MSKTNRTQQSEAETAGDLGTWDDLRLAFHLYRDPRVSSLLKWFVPMVAALYVISPIDLIPDFLLGAGQIDDLGVLGIAFFVTLNLIRRLAPKTIVAEHLSEMGRNGVRSSEPTASSQTGEVIETTFRVSDRPNDRTYQRTAEDGRRVA
jgi:uncharacterized membrane protein YkvA (DUF1232 family)